MIKLTMCLFIKPIPKPFEYRIYYDYSQDICKEDSPKYLFYPVSRKKMCFSEEGIQRPKITGSRYADMNLPHDTNHNWGMFGKNLVITIDDSYDFPSTKRMFELLKRYNITATFFPNTAYINEENAEHVQLWKDIYDSGYEIGYHTTNHERKKSVGALNEDFAEFTEKMKRIVGDNTFSIKMVRAPYGYWDKVWTQWVVENNLLSVRWTITENEDGNYLRELYGKDIGRVLLLHNKEEDIEWLTNHFDELIQIAKENGGELGSIYDSIIR